MIHANLRKSASTDRDLVNRFDRSALLKRLGSPELIVAAGRAIWWPRTTLLRFANDGRTGCQKRVSKRIWRRRKKPPLRRSDAMIEKSLKPFLLSEAGFQEDGRRKITSRRCWYERLRFSSRR
jgi:hypothetical protein